MISIAAINICGRVTDITLVIKGWCIAIALALCSVAVAQNSKQCGDRVELRAHLKEIMTAHPGGKLNKMSHTITWNSAKAIASSIEYAECTGEATVLTKHVRTGQLSDEKIFSVALAMGNTFFHEDLAQRLQQAVFKNRFRHRSENGAELYELMDKDGDVAFNIEYNSVQRLVRLSMPE